MNDWTPLPDPDEPSRPPSSAPAPAHAPAEPADRWARTTPQTEPADAIVVDPTAPGLSLPSPAAGAAPGWAAPPPGYGTSLGAAPPPGYGTSLGAAPPPGYGTSPGYGFGTAPAPSPYRLGGSTSWPSGPPSGPPGGGWSPGTPSPPTAPPSAPKKHARGAIVASVLGVLVVLGLVAAFVGLAAGGDDEVAGAAPAAPEVPVSVPSAPPPISGASDEPIADVARAVGPSVVLIATTEGEGSGIIYDASGLIITNAHVVGTAKSVAVQLADGTIYDDATVVGADSVRDVAVVRFTPKGPITAATFGRIDDVRVGQTAVAIGSPFGLEQTVTAGIVSAVGRVISDRNPVEMIQTDAPINPGNSGGALADKQGRVIGMNTSIRTTGTNSGSVGVGFAVPADTFLNVASRIVKGESLAVAYLGIRGSTPTGGGVSGVVISSVTSGSPAASAGLQPGDLISALNGTKVTTMAGLSARVQLQKPGDTIELTIERSGRAQSLKVTLAAVR
jgi:putative serine protease PepD